ncbi:MAG TPA: LysM domain-containing protein, partial [Oscillospiraceae bacterium]|nr:LysM domain-containing protein [Oscillospiraceae bacterium]
MFDYIVQPGDNLYRIADYFDVSVQAILAVNPRLNPNFFILDNGFVYRSADGCIRVTLGTIYSRMNSYVSHGVIGMIEGCGRMDGVTETDGLTGADGLMEADGLTGADGL